VALCAAPAAAEVIWRGDFETGDTSQWRGASQSAAVNVVTHPVRAGKYALRIDGTNAARRGTRDRIELQHQPQPPGTAEGTERYFGWSVYVPKQLTNDGHAVGYFETRNSWRQLMSFEARGADLLYTTRAPYRRHWSGTEKLTPGRWHDFAVHVLWSRDPSRGFVEVWFDGQQVVRRTNTATLLDENPAFFQIGLMRDTIDVPETIVIDHVIEATTLAEVTPPPLAAGNSSTAALAARSPGRDPDELATALATLIKVGQKAAGNREATQAWSVVAGAEAAQLTTILAALDHAGPLAANYLRSAVDAVAERCLARQRELPTTELEEFVRDVSHAPRSRQLAFEWLTKFDTQAPARLIPGFLNDPSLELRREAVARLMAEGAALVEQAQGDKQRQAAAIAMLKRAFEAAREPGQIDKLDKELTRLGEQVDLVAHYGYLTTWHVIGPFDNRGGGGFETVYPPEEKIDFAARYQGKNKELGWLAHTTTDREGKVDLNEVLGKDMGCVGYAAAEFYSAGEQQVDLRYGTQNATKVWLNGKLVARHRVYHTGSTTDQYKTRATLQPGRNVILVKICQNEQTQSWAQVWEVKFRVCDAIGTAVVSATPNGENKNATN
jgi:hypothetical protein